MTPEQEIEQHDAILLVRKDVKDMKAILKAQPCKQNTEMLTRHDEKIKTLWIPFTTSIAAMVGLIVVAFKSLLAK